MQQAGWCAMFKIKSPVNNLVSFEYIQDLQYFYIFLVMFFFDVYV